MTLRSDHLSLIDFDRAAEDQHGLGARAVQVGDHLYDWRAAVGDQEFPIDVRRAVDYQHGLNADLVKIGLQAGDWRATHLADLSDVVVPVVLRASDQTDILGVGEAIARFGAIVIAVREWYAAHARMTFAATVPLLVDSGHSSGEWAALSEMTRRDEHRYVFFYEVVNEVRRLLPLPSSRVVYAIAVAAGVRPELSEGAAALNGFVVVPPRATSVGVDITDPAAGDAVYALGHELGHAFGLRHPCKEPALPDCDASLMQAARPPRAILLPEEIEQLRGSSYFRPRGRPARPA